jgi:hypothetical protein
MRNGASAEGRANSLKVYYRGSSRSTLPRFLLEQGYKRMAAISIAQTSAGQQQG